MSTTADWEPDEILGTPYERRDIPLGRDDEGELLATLIHRHQDQGSLRDMPAVLVLHGWSDYVFQRTLLERLHEEGMDVWGLDLRKSGRSLRPGQTPTEVIRLEDYDRELDAALGAIGRDRRPILLAHSAGGLVAVLWAMRHAATVSGVALNSPWLVAPLGAVGRGIARRALAPVARRRPGSPILPRGPKHYARIVHTTYGGEFDFDTRLKPEGGHPFPVATLHAILEGQRLSAAGQVEVPVLVLRSDASRLSLRFDERMRRADSVLDVHAMDSAARQLGPDVRVEVLPGAVHDVFLSPPAVRERAMHVLRRWLGGIGVLPPADPR